MYTGNPLRGTLANSEYPDEMQHHAAFYQGLHCLLGLKQHSETEINHNLEDLNLHNGQSHTYWIIMYGIIHQNTKG